MKDVIRSLLKIGFIERLWYLVVKDKPYGLWYTKFTPNHYSYNNPSYRTVSRKGINYTLNITNIVDWNLYFGFKEISKEKLFTLDSNPDTIIDIGANIGEISLNFAKLYPSATVYGFEPHPETFQTLSANVRLNNFQNLHIQNIGLGANDAFVYFEERQEGNPGMNRVTSNPEQAKLQIKITTLDSFLANNSPQKISVIKMDVEGYEMEVLKGAEQTLKTHKPKLFIELDDTNLKEQNSNASELITYLLELGYAIQHAENYESINDKSDLKGCHFDIICS